MSTVAWDKARIDQLSSWENLVDSLPRLYMHVHHCKHMTNNVCFERY